MLRLNRFTDERLVACARKLLIFANTVLARGTPWLSQTTQT
jgi:hypothetical protein